MLHCRPLPSLADMADGRPTHQLNTWVKYNMLGEASQCRKDRELTGATLENVVTFPHLPKGSDVSNSSLPSNLEIPRGSMAQKRRSNSGSSERSSQGSSKPNKGPKSSNNKGTPAKVPKSSNTNGTPQKNKKSSAPGNSPSMYRPETARFRDDHDNEATHIRDILSYTNVS